MTSVPEHVIVRLPNWVGDACMALPALRLLEGAGLALTLVGKPWAEALFAAHGWGFVAHRANPIRQRAALQSMSDQRPVAGLLLPNSLSSAMSFSLAGIASAGYRTDGRTPLLRWAFDKPRGLHEVEVFHRLASLALHAWTGSSLAAAPEAELGLKISDTARVRAEDALRAAGVDSPFIVLAPVASGTVGGRTKQWPHFAQLARRLVASGHRIAACPAPSEEALVSAVLPDAVLLQALPLDDLAAVFARSATVVANDSGAAHVAAAAGARVIVLHGVTDPRRTGAWSPRALALGDARGWPGLEQVLAAVSALPK